MSKNILKPKAVGHLLNQNDDGSPVYNFFIPSYQRGYRWDINQVKDLMDDLLEFITAKVTTSEKYCLQPIVVKQLPDAKYEVLDGQQRLTTIFILLFRLKQTNNEIELFKVEYETRPDSEKFLNSNLSLVLNTDNPDYFYMSQAYQVIDQWLIATKKSRANIASLLFNTLVDSVEFIWYEITQETDAIDVFTRINIGKIPLTNAELVKAVFLSKNNLSLGYADLDKKDDDFNKILTMKQNMIAIQWDSIEKTLQDSKIWGFIYSGTNVFETRIDYLLDIISKKEHDEKNKYHSFNFFYEKVKRYRYDKSVLEDFTNRNQSVMEFEWDELREIYDILVEWYHDKVYNHLIGFLITQNVNIAELVRDFKIYNRDEFLDYIKCKTRSFVDCKDISELRYNTGVDKKIERILLLHNIISSIQVNGNGLFPFEQIRNNNWSLEHIFAQNSDDLRESDYRNWLNDHLLYFKTKMQNDQISEIILKIEMLLKKTNIEKELFEDCFSKVSNYVQDKLIAINRIDDSFLDNNNIDVKNSDWLTDDHSIANLALLDGRSNSALKNALFDIKRTIIIERDKKGLYIPHETKKVFMKYYTASPDHLSYWTYQDRKAYIESINDALNYLN